MKETASAAAETPRGGAAAKSKSFLGGIDFGLIAYFALWYLGNYYYNITNKMALTAAGGKTGISRFPSCVDVMVLPSGIVMVIGSVATFRLTMCVSGVQMCTVHPVSNIMLLFSVGGPKSVGDVLVDV